MAAYKILKHLYPMDDSVGVKHYNSMFTDRVFEADSDQLKNFNGVVEEHGQE